MRVADMNWMQLADYLAHDDKVVLPLGSTEQHAYLSLMTDAILAERVAVEAAEPLGVPVFPALAYGITPYFLAFPGSLSLRVSTYLAVVRDLLDALAGQGAKRIVLVNGHGGNSPAASLTGEWMADHPGVTVALHNWWNAPPDLGGGAGGRPAVFAWLVDGKLSLEPGRPRAVRPETDGRSEPPARALAPGCEGSAGRRQLRRGLREARRADAVDLARRGRGNPRGHRRPVGADRCMAHDCERWPGLKRP